MKTALSRAVFLYSYRFASDCRAVFFMPGKDKNMNKDTFFTSLTDEELKVLMEIISPMAAGALLTETKESVLHERALRKLTEALTAEMDDRESAAIHNAR